MMGLSKSAWSVSMFLHGTLVALLIFGPSLRPTIAPPIPAGNVLEAVVVDPSVLDLPPLAEPTGPTPAEIAREQAQQERLDRERIAKEQEEAQERERVRLQEEQEKEAEREQERQKELQAAADRKKEEELEKERIRLQKIEEEKAEKQRVAQEQEAERIRQEEAAAKAEQERIEAEKERERLAKEEAERKEKERLEAERREKIEAEKKAAREKAAAEALAAQLEREEQMRRAMGLESQRNEAVDNGLLAQYIAQIVAKVERNWNKPPSAREGLSCTVRASQLPGGDVASVEIVECNGDEVVQRSIENAVFKASPLPEPADPTLFERNLVFIFEPK